MSFEGFVGKKQQTFGIMLCAIHSVYSPLYEGSSASNNFAHDLAAMHILFSVQLGNEFNL